MKELEKETKIARELISDAAQAHGLEMGDKSSSSSSSSSSSDSILFFKSNFSQT